MSEFYGITLETISMPFFKDFSSSSLLSDSLSVPLSESGREENKSTVVPFRNGVMLSVLASVADGFGCKYIAIGNQYTEDSIYLDSKKEFIDKISSAIKVGTDSQIEVLSPLCDMTKTEVVQLGNRLGTPFELTWTCYNNHELQCGECSSCVKRKKAFLENKLTDPVGYYK